MSTYGNLIKGNTPCRCRHKRKNVPESEILYDINKICKELNISFIGWENNYENSSSKLLWIDDKGTNRKSCVRWFFKRYKL